MSILNIILQFVDTITLSAFGVAIAVRILDRLLRGVSILNILTAAPVSSILFKYISVFRTRKDNQASSVLNPSVARIPLGAQKILYFFLPRGARESIPGDLEEEYRSIILPKFGKTFAHRWFWFQTLRSVLEYNGLTARLIKIVEAIKQSSS